MADIYTIPIWVTGTIYEEDAIVLVGAVYYYSTVRHLSGATFAADLASDRWSGVLVNDSLKRPYFRWKSSFKYSLNVKPSVRKIQFGDGYVSEFTDGINNIMLPFDAVFENRNLYQYTAILHFLTTRAGVEKFYFIPPSPFNVIKTFICSEWTASQQFYENYTITAKFEERA